MAGTAMPGRRIHAGETALEPITARVSSQLSPSTRPASSTVGTVTNRAAQPRRMRSSSRSMPVPPGFHFR